MNITPPVTPLILTTMGEQPAGAKADQSQGTTAYHPHGAMQRQSWIQSEKDIFFAPYQATGRPRGDRRTADQIINANPIFKHLPLSIPKESLYRYLGDWTNTNPNPQSRADAAFNAARVFNYIDGINVKESARGDNTKGNARIEGEYQSPLPPPFDEVEIIDGDGSEAALLKKFSKEGYTALDDHGTPLPWDNEKITLTKPTGSAGRPRGERRSAEQILNANPIVERFVKALADHPYRASILDNLKAQTGDWSENNKDARSRGDAAYNVSKVANYLDAHPNFYRYDEGFNDIGPGHLTGLGRWNAEPGTEAAAFIAFCKKGYAALPNPASGHSFSDR